MGESGWQPDRAWHGFRGGRLPDDMDPAFAPLAEALGRFSPVPGARDHPVWADAAPQTLLIEEVEALWAPIAQADDWAPLEAKLAAIRRLGEALGDPVHRPPR
jgi:hypothetical protein